MDLTDDFTLWTESSGICGAPDEILQDSFQANVNTSTHTVE